MLKIVEGDGGKSVALPHMGNTKVTTPRQEYQAKVDPTRDRPWLEVLKSVEEKVT